MKKLTQSEVRKHFWSYLKETNEDLYKEGKRSKRQNDQVTDIRCCFVDWLDGMRVNGEITEKQAGNYTL
jgi:ABC-type uncharacterized transport system YnjBCD substrate-binding protein